jgi:hypothetical protein
MSTSQLVESYRFWDVVALWARESLVHEEVVARALARGVIRDGLRFMSVDPRWLKPGASEAEFRGYPYVGFAAKPDSEVVILRIEALQHLLAVVERAEIPNREVLFELFVSRDDFLTWLKITNQPLPDFWYSDKERLNVQSRDL